MGLEALMSWGPEKMLIRCHKENQHPAEWALGLRLNIKRTRKTQRDGHNSGVKIWSLCSVSSTLSHANPWTTLSNPCNKVRGEYFSKKSLLASSFLHLNCYCVRRLFMRLSLMLCRCDAEWWCRWLYNKNAIIHIIQQRFYVINLMHTQKDESFNLMLFFFDFPQYIIDFLLLINSHKYSRI